MLTPVHTLIEKHHLLFLVDLSKRTRLPVNRLIRQAITEFVQRNTFPETPTPPPKNNG